MGMQHRPTPTICTTSSSDARDNDEDNWKKPHLFLREESDKSFLWSRGGWSSSGGSSDLAPNLECGWQGVFRKYHQLERNWKQGTWRRQDPGVAPPSLLHPLLRGKATALERQCQRCCCVSCVPVRQVRTCAEGRIVGDVSSLTHTHTLSLVTAYRDDKAARLDPLRSAAGNQGARLGDQLPADARELQRFVGRR
jgi:hypothetical protein